ncbi:methylmalonyl Co-A mutase-associated GTPase MeaB [Myxococcota bacterium]|nr:methylmalonyl Co-A mutase-associated GTPase MeaB [Myxococcota bacterium]MCZ7619326.1 methylmalonyl Co-A mutase-associated GTPase MeaB [Myxococcota bacterium]
MSVDPRAVAEHRDGIRRGDRRLLAKTITLLESRRADRAALGQAVLEALVPDTGRAFRVGISGTPGVGKSSFIEALGLHLIGQGQRVSVLAVDPSSPRTGGSILGDKTRMERLAQDERAFIRPSPSGGSLGGVAHRTRETLLLCEAAGFDVVLVETVGIGQSEAAVASMVDFFAVLLQPGAGDELQGMKKGVLELADALVVHKADGELLPAARRARLEYQHALDLLRPSSAHWRPPVLLASARSGDGISEVWDTIRAHRRALEASGELDARRREQARAWLWSLIGEGLEGAFRSHPGVAQEVPRLEAEVTARKTTAAAAARMLLAMFSSPPRS